MTRAVSIAQGGSNNVTMRNRIINGAMMIDQRNAGASVNTNQTFPVDRFKQLMSGGGVLTSQQSSTVPSNFTKSLSITVSTADSSIASTDYYFIAQQIEGYNIADLGWGTASASAVTLSFWVRSSVTGTFSGGLENNDSNRGYVFTYTINSANTWEYKTVTVPGDTTGTWNTDNTQGIQISFDLGTGTSRCITTANTWGVQRGIGLQSATKLISTLDATFYITGVQLEAGTTATPFEQRLYGTELALCQRYYQELLFTGDVLTGQCQSAIAVAGTYHFKQDMRAAPTVTVPASGNGTGGGAWLNSGGNWPANFGTNFADQITNKKFRLQGSSYTSSFVAGNASNFYSASNGKFTMSAEL